jgi:6-phosphogluconolactonase (cycloisomerase 2 family)
MASKVWRLRLQGWLRAGSLAAAGSSLLLTGCAGFFVYPGSTTAAGASGNTVFALSPTLGTVSAYTIGSSTLTLGTGSPITLPANVVSSTAGAITVSRNDSFLYVGGLNYIYCYTIGASGALTLVSSSSVTTSANTVSMDTSPDGSWLFALDTLTQTVFQFSLNTSTGALALTKQVGYNIASGAANAPKTIHATSTLVAAALGTGGDALFTYAEATGLTYATTITLPYTTESDNDLAISSNGDYLFISRSGAAGSTTLNDVAAYDVSSPGTPAAIGSLVAAGTTPYSIVMNTAGTDLYVANRGANTISEFSVSTSGAVAPLTTASVAAGMEVTSLAPDSTGNYLFAGGIASSADLQMYTFKSGALTSATTASTSEDASGLQLATTH